MTQQFTPAQLEAWAGLGPWEWCENWLYVANYNEHPGPVLWCTANDDGVHAKPDDAALIAAAPDLARLVLEKDAEIARKDAEIGELSYEIECLRIALFKYGDRLGMANGPASLQGAIDEAMGQVLRPYKRALPPSHEGNQ